MLLIYLLYGIPSAVGIIGGDSLVGLVALYVCAGWCWLVVFPWCSWYWLVYCVDGMYFRVVIGCVLLVILLLVVWCWYLVVGAL